MYDLMPWREEKKVTLTCIHMDAVNLCTYNVFCIRNDHLPCTQEVIYSRPSFGSGLSSLSRAFSTKAIRSQHCNKAVVNAGGLFFSARRSLRRHIFTGLYPVQ